jgi:hypothetical protein
MGRRVVVDTCVLQAANAPLEHTPREGRAILDRIALLKRLLDGVLTPAWSKALWDEYQEHVPEPGRNDFIVAFYALLAQTPPTYTKLTGAQRSRLRTCRYPPEDVHLLRTALPGPATIATEEDRLLRVDAPVHRYFQVHVRTPGET